MNFKLSLVLLGLALVTVNAGHILRNRNNIDCGEDCDPGSGEPGSGEPGSGEPGSHEPGSGEPGSCEPGSGEPGSGEPGSGEPGSGEEQDPCDPRGPRCGRRECGRIPDPRHCDKFFECKDGHRSGPHSCQHGLHFNPVTRVCDKPENCHCVPVHCPEPNPCEPFCPWDYCGPVRDPRDPFCKKFVQCKNGRIVAEGSGSCGWGLKFDPRDNNCHDKNSVSCPWSQCHPDCGGKKCADPEDPEEPTETPAPEDPTDAPTTAAPEDPTDAPTTSAPEDPTDAPTSEAPVEPEDPTDAPVPRF